MTHWPGEFPQKLSSKPCDRAIDTLCKLNKGIKPITSRVSGSCFCCWSCTAGWALFLEISLQLTVRTARFCISALFSRRILSNLRKKAAVQAQWWSDIVSCDKSLTMTVLNDHDRDLIFGLYCRQQSIPISFWLNRPQQHDHDVVWRQNFQIDHDFGVD